MTSNNFNNGNNSDSLRLQQIDCSSAAGAPTLTTPTLTPTTLRNIEQMFLEASGNGNNLEQPVIHENAAHFVPPPIAMELPPPLPGPTSVEVPPPLPGPIIVPDVLPTHVQSNQVPSLLAIKSEPPEMNSRSKSSNNNNVITNDCTVPTPVSMSEEERKKHLRRERNKEAAARCRKRRLDQISTLTEEVNQLESIRKEMQQERAALEVKLQSLKSVLELHQCSLKQSKK
jgi:fos-like antigen